MTQAERAARLRALHQGPSPLLLPNAWDAASARLLETSGFPAVASSSAGVAAALGYADGAIPAREMLAGVATIARAVAVPVTADLEDGYVATADLAAFVVDTIATGAVGLNLEDVRRGEATLVDLDEQLARIRTIRAAADRAGVPLVINARTDVFLRQIGAPAAREPLSVARANAFLEAGADCAFVPGVVDRDLIGRLAAAIRGPLNVLAAAPTPVVRELQMLGVRRISLGSGPARLALAALRDLCEDLRTRGTFERLAHAIPYDDVNRLMERRP